jgi:ketosteroid isomerase-like protein
VSPLPLADTATAAELRDWLDRFASCVRDVDYARARPFFHPDVVAFGTHRDVITGLAQWQSAQWDNVWPRTSDFRFDMESVKFLALDAMAIAVAPWTSTGYHEDGTAFERPGRATMVFRREAEGWLCVHSHMSLNRGVPQASFADRPVKAR